MAQRQRSSISKARSRAASPAAEHTDDVRSPLRLAAARGSLALELYEPVQLDPLEVVELSLSLPGLKFPLDLSGGVPAFRHRRGQLEHARIRLDTERCAKFLGRAARALLPNLARPVTVWALQDGGIGVGLVGDRGEGLAFDLLWAPAEGDAQVIVTDARGVALGGPALGYALRLADTALGRLCTRRGRVLVFDDAATRLARAVLPALGARAPRTTGVRFGALGADDGDAVEVELDSTFVPPALGHRTLRALELAQLTSQADDALAAGDVGAARAEYLSCLERAPRHPELALLIAESDMTGGADPESALALIVECLPAVNAGSVGAELLSRVGDVAAARAALVSAASSEVFGPIASLAWARLATVEGDAAGRLSALDEAVARSPGLGFVRMQRFVAELRSGQLAKALADAQHLEAMARGARARHELCRAIAQQLLNEGFVRDAGAWFERALRYSPDDASSMTGLARALVQTGRQTRAIPLFERALRLAEARSEPRGEPLVELAELIASELGDLPQAIARLRDIDADDPSALRARWLEASFRERLGDLVGASLAYARFREALELSQRATPAMADWLLGAARFEHQTQGDVMAAERHLATALRLAPRSAPIASAYREVAALVAERRRGVPAPLISGKAADAPARLVLEPVPAAAADATDEQDEGALHQRATELESALRANAGNWQAAVELASVLEALGRDQDLVALLSARLEEADDNERPHVVALAVKTLSRLEREAADEGRGGEAELYRMMRQRIDPVPR